MLQSAELGATIAVGPVPFVWRISACSVQAYFWGCAALASLGDKPASAKARPSLVPSLREADRVVERAKLPPEAFLDGSGNLNASDGTRRTAGNAAVDGAVKRKAEVTDGLKHAALMAEPHNHSITVTAINDLDGGAAMVIGSWERDAKGVTFYNAQEREQLAGWARRLDEDEAQYRSHVETWNKCVATKNLDNCCVATDYSGRCGQYLRADPARDRNLDIERLAADRDVALRPINEAAHGRAERYSRIRFELHCAPELAAKLDRVAILRRSRVSIVLQVEDVDLGLAAPDIPVPAVITLIRGQLIDVDRQELLKVKDGSTNHSGE